MGPVFRLSQKDLPPCNIGQKNFTLYKTGFLAREVSIPAAEILVRQCLDGDAAAYRMLYDKYARAMFNTALRIVNSIPDAEDVLQDAFTDAFGQLRSFEQRSTFGAWLKRIVIFKSIAFLKRKKMHFVEMDMIGDLAEDELPDEREIWYTVDVIRQTMKQLPDGYRTVLTLYLFEGYDHEEIADILHVAGSTVRTQYIRARKKLLQLLNKREVYEQ